MNNGRTSIKLLVSMFTCHLELLTPRGNLDEYFYVKTLFSSKRIRFVALKKCSGIVYIDGSLLPFLHTEFQVDPVRNNVLGRPTVS